MGAAQLDRHGRDHVAPEHGDDDHVPDDEVVRAARFSASATLHSLSQLSLRQRVMLRLAHLLSLAEICQEANCSRNVWSAGVTSKASWSPHQGSAPA